MRFLIFILLIGLLPYSVFSQDTDDQANPDFDETQELTGNEGKFDWDKVTIEPNFAFALSNRVTYLGLAPYVGYEIFPKMYAGPGIIYFFSRYKDVEPINENVDLHTIGGGVFAQYFVYEQAFVRAKFEFLNRKLLYGVNQNNEPIYRKTNVPVLLIGAGYNLGMGSNFQFPIMVAYDVIQDDDSPYFSTGGFPLYIQLGFISYF